MRKEKLGGYSGGMRQRFGIAVALLGDPKLIIVDEEATNNLRDIDEGPYKPIPMGTE